MRSFLKTWKEELIGIPIALSLFYFSPSILRLIDPTSGAFDIGVLHKIALMAIQLLICSAMSWIGVRLTFPELFKYFQKEFWYSFQNLNDTEWRKLKTALFVYCFYLACAIFLLQIR